MLRTRVNIRLVSLTVLQHQGIELIPTILENIYNIFYAITSSSGHFDSIHDGRLHTAQGSILHGVKDKGVSDRYLKGSS